MLLDERDLLRLDVLPDLLLPDLLLPDLLLPDLLLPDLLLLDGFFAVVERLPDDFEEPPDDVLVEPDDPREEPLDFACGDEPFEPFDDPVPSCPPASRLTPPITLEATPIPSRLTFLQSVRRLPTGSPRTVDRLLSLRGLFIAASFEGLRRPAVAGSGGGLTLPPGKTRKLGHMARKYAAWNAE